MTPTEKAGIKWITLYGLLLYTIWGILVIIDPQAMNATPIGTIAKWVGHNQYALAAIFLSASIAAYVSLITEVVNKVAFQVLIIPQLTLMLFSAGGCLFAALTGHYYDGTPMSASHIFGDQLPWILGAAVYTSAIWTQRWREHKFQPLVAIMPLHTLAIIGIGGISAILFGIAIATWFRIGM